MEIAKEKSISVDKNGFMSMLEKAREESKARAKFIPKGEWTWGPKQQKGSFVGYDKPETQTQILHYNAYDDVIEIVLKESPFYAEAGGQVGDRGVIVDPAHFVLSVLDTYWYQGMIVCHCKLKTGQFTPFQKDTAVTARVDTEHRKESARAHTATHLLHAALRKILGEHARQEGSYVEPGRFRFDFTHFKPLSDDEITAVEDLVTKKILEAIPVEKKEMPLDEAKKLGAMAIFGEKYGDVVRVVRIGDFSIELCGGIHLDNTGETGFFKITSQEAAAAGIRRVEAIVGLRLFQYIRSRDAIIKEVSRLTGREDGKIVKWVSETQTQLRKTEREFEEALTELARTEAMVLLAKLWEDKNHFITKELKNYGQKGMRLVADIIRDKAKRSVGFLYENVNNKINYLIFVGQDIVKELPANKLIKEVSTILGGGGGGKVYMAEGGGGNPQKISETVKFLKSKLQK
jgi:alanyl-tRNA synthetase